MDGFKNEKKQNLKFGEVGYIVTGAKDLSQIRVGDTLVAGDGEASRRTA